VFNPVEDSSDDNEVHRGSSIRPTKWRERGLTVEMLAPERTSYEYFRRPPQNKNVANRFDHFRDNDNG